MSGAPPNKHINLTVASVTPLASVPSSVHPALGEQQATRRPAAFAADATAGYAQRYAHFHSSDAQESSWAS